MTTKIKLPSVAGIPTCFIDLRLNTFSAGKEPPVGQKLLVFEASRSHSNTQHAQQTNTTPPAGIRKHILSKRAGAEPRLRPRATEMGHLMYTGSNFVLISRLKFFIPCN